VGWERSPPPGVPHDSKRAREKRRDMEDGVRGSLWAFEGVPRDRLEQRFVEMVKKLMVIGVLPHENMSWGGGGPKEELALAHLGFLFKGYRVGVWYWEVVELMRKLTFNALMVFIFPGSRAQLICGFSIAALFMLASAKFAPHKDKRVAALHFIASIALCVTLLYAIAIRLMEQGPTSPGDEGLRELLSWLTVLLICFILAFPAVMYLFNTDLNPFILWSRLCNKGARRVETQGDTSPMALARSPIRRRNLPNMPRTSAESVDLDSVKDSVKHGKPGDAAGVVSVNRRQLAPRTCVAGQEPVHQRLSVGVVEAESEAGGRPASATIGTEPKPAEEQVVVSDAVHDAVFEDSVGVEGLPSLARPHAAPAEIVPCPSPGWFHDGNP